MITLQPTSFRLTLKDGQPIDLTLEEAQELCAALMTTLAPTLQPGPHVSTDEPAPLIPADIQLATGTP